MSKVSLPSLPVVGGLVDATQLDACFTELLAGVNSVDQTQLAPQAVLGLFNIKDYGAVMDGVTDDSAAIQAAFAAAAVLGGTVVFPSPQNPANSIYYASAAPIAIPPNVGVQTVYPCQILGGPLTTSCYHMLPAPANQKAVPRYSFLPDVQNFTNPTSGIAVWFDAVNATTKYFIGEIDNCNEGIRFDASNGQCGMTITCGEILYCMKGVRYYSSTGLYVHQGNFVLDCYIASLVACEIDVLPNVGGFAYNGIVGASGIDGSPSKFRGATTGLSITARSGGLASFDLDCFYYFDNFSGNAIQCAGTSFISQFHLNINSSTNLTYAAWNFGVNSGPMQIINSKSGPSVGIAASTVNNSRATWNGGVALPFNKIPLTFAIPASTAAGTVLVYYVYHPWANGPSTPTFTTQFSPGGPGGNPVVTSCVDFTADAPNEIRITLTLISASGAAATTLVGFLAIGGVA